jgi:hypothetical protein
VHLPGDLLILFETPTRSVGISTIQGDRQRSDGFDGHPGRNFRWLMVFCSRQRILESHAWNCRGTFLTMTSARVESDPAPEAAGLAQSELRGEAVGKHDAVISAVHLSGATRELPRT